MAIISINQYVKAGIEFHRGLLEIESNEDPSFIQSETVLVDLMHRNIGIIFQSAYHHIGKLPGDLTSEDVEKVSKALLRGQGQGGRDIQLRAPVKIV